MRMLDDDTNAQVFNACIMLTREEINDLIDFLQNCLENKEPLADHYHIFDQHQPTSVSKTRVMREIMALHYEPSNASVAGWHPRTLRLIKDEAGQIDNLGPEH